MRRRSQDFDFPPDVIINEDGQFNLVDGSEEEWPEGMDGHIGDPYDPRNPQNNPAQQWQEILDKGSIGRSARFSSTTPSASGFDGNGNVPAQLINVRGPDTRPAPLTVQVGTLEDGLASSQLGLFARIQWGVENYENQADVDIGQGLMLAVYASALRVSIGADPTLNVGTLVRVGANVSYGVRAAHAPPTRTIRGSGTVAAAATGMEASIPRFARGVYPMPLVTTAGQNFADFVVRQKDLGGTVLAEFPYANGVVSPVRIPLLNDARLVDIENIDAANELRMHWIFDLAL